MARSKNFSERFSSYLLKEPEGCWLWTKYIDPISGYGIACGNGKIMKAHRAAWELAYPEACIPKGLFVLHKCDVRHCCRPDHLFLGTQQDNMDDMVSKGRSLCRKGEDGPNSKLTWSQVKEIRNLLSTQTCATLSRKFQVSESTIRNIKFNRTYVEEPSRLLQQECNTLDTFL